MPKQTFEQAPQNDGKERWYRRRKVQAGIAALALTAGGITAALGFGQSSQPEGPTARPTVEASIEQPTIPTPEDAEIIATGWQGYLEGAKPLQTNGDPSIAIPEGMAAYTLSANITPTASRDVGEARHRYGDAGRDSYFDTPGLRATLVHTIPEITTATPGSDLDITSTPQWDAFSGDYQAVAYLPTDAQIGDKLVIWTDQAVETSNGETVQGSNLLDGGVLTYQNIGDTPQWILSGSDEVSEALAAAPPAHRTS